MMRASPPLGSLPPPPPRSLRRTIAVPVIGLGLLLAVIAGAVVGTALYLRQLDRVQDEISAVIETNRDPLSFATWGGDRAMIGMILTAINAHPYITASQLEADYIGPVNIGTPAREPMRQEAALYWTIDGQTTRIGFLTVTADLADIRDLLIGQLAAVAAVVTAVVVGMAGLLLVFLQRVVARPTERLAEQALAFSSRSPAEIASFDFHQNKDGAPVRMAREHTALVAALDRVRLHLGDTLTRLHDSEDRYRAAFAGARDGLWDWHPGSPEVYLSARALTILGLDAANGEGRTVATSRVMGCLAATHRAAVLDAVDRHRRGETPALEVRCPLEAHGTGPRRWVEFRGKGLRGGRRDGTLVRIAGSLTDITERVEAENRLTQMRQAELVGQMSSGLAHDFNNLLTLVLFNLDVLKTRFDGILDPRDEQLLDDAVAAGRQGRDLVNQLLLFARRRDPVKIRLNLPDSLAQVGRMVGRSLPATVRLLTAGATPEPQTDTGLWIDADPTQLESAVVNLILNARDALPAGGGEITVSARPDGPDRVLLEIADTGCGMPAAVLEQAATPFFTTKPVGQGTGLGLSMVAAFAEAASGTLSIDSQPGAGTRVRLSFPRRSPPDRPPPATVPGPLPQGEGEHLLVVEDEAPLLQTVAETARELGYRVSTAATAAEARRIFTRLMQMQDAPALVLTDITMPPESTTGPVPDTGVDLADWLTRQPEPPRILLMTAAGQPEPHLLRVCGSPSSPWPILPKPFLPADLANALHRIRTASRTTP